MTNRQISLDETDRVEDLSFTPLERKYLKVQYIKVAIAYVVLMSLPFLILLADRFDWQYVIVAGIECILLIAFIINMTMLPRAYAYKGFAIREHDITYRSGIVFPKVTTIPFCKIQQVSISQNIITRPLGLYSVDLTNGAQMIEATSIPGLTEKVANEIKALVIEHTRRENN